MGRGTVVEAAGNLAGGSGVACRTMTTLRRSIAPFVAALLLVAVAAVPLAHRWLHHGMGGAASEATVTTSDTHCDLCAASFAEPPAPAPPVDVAFIADAPAPVPVVDTGVARLLEAIGRAPPKG